jgi:hypothetical protein
VQGLGYLISIVSVFLLASVAWPKPGDPAWMFPVLLAGITTSVIGMILRFIAHRRQRAEVKRAKAMAAQNG